MAKPMMHSIVLHPCVPYTTPFTMQYYYPCENEHQPIVHCAIYCITHSRVVCISNNSMNSIHSQSVRHRVYKQFHLFSICVCVCVSLCGIYFPFIALTSYALIDDTHKQYYRTQHYTIKMDSLTSK